MTYTNVHYISRLDAMREEYEREEIALRAHKAALERSNMQAYIRVLETDKKLLQVKLKRLERKEKARQQDKILAACLASVSFLGGIIGGLLTSIF